MIFAKQQNCLFTVLTNIWSVRFRSNFDCELVYQIVRCATVTPERCWNSNVFVSLFYSTGICYKTWKNQTFFPQNDWILMKKLIFFIIWILFRYFFPKKWEIKKIKSIFRRNIQVVVRISPLTANFTALFFSSRRYRWNIVNKQSFFTLFFNSF